MKYIRPKFKVGDVGVVKLKNEYRQILILDAYQGRAKWVYLTKDCIDEDDNSLEWLMEYEIIDNLSK